MTWDPTLHPDEVNLSWSLLRAIEWGRWPIFLSQPLVPVLLLLLDWKVVVFGIIMTNLLWASFVRYRFVSVAAAYWGATLVRLKWLTCPLAAFYLFVRGRPGVAAISLLWPFLIFVVGALPTTQVGRIQNMFMAKLGYERARGVPKTRHGLAPTIGPYRLDMKATDVSRLVELTPTEKEALNVAVEFRNERIYHAPHAEFAGASWDIVLGAVDSRVYKISALLMVQNREQRDTMWRTVDGQLRTPLGAPASTATTIIAWDTEDGNVVMNRAEGGGAYALVLTLTSRAVSDFLRIK